ncbi:PIN domain-containing protein [Pyrococcus kukulkanii]|uniref:PIN domain-containing protein n=1 Tax=Pyrococcus kukulkanii TaxID=1609559 RepID=A0ABV4T449_9EURY
MGSLAVIDTNVLIYSINKRSERYREARKILESLDELIIPVVVVYEFIWNLAEFGISSKVAKDVLSRILLDPRVKLVDDRKHLLPAFEKLGGLSLRHYNDSMILSVAEEFGTLATYDRKLRKRAEKLGIDLLPRNI